MKPTLSGFTPFDASDILVMAGTRYRFVICHSHGLIVSRADEPAAPLYLSPSELLKPLETGTLTIEQNGRTSEASHG
jgi:hypothetical protein